MQLVRVGSRVICCFPLLDLFGGFVLFLFWFCVERLGSNAFCLFVESFFVINLDLVG